MKFLAVAADTGAIGGSGSHEFHVLADSGEDAIAFTSEGNYAANVELAEAAAPAAPRPSATEAMEKVATPKQKTCEEVAALLGLPLDRTVKSFAVVGDQGLVLVLVRGDHMVNEIKLQKLAGLAEYRLASEDEIVEHLGSVPGFIGPVAPVKAITVVADRSVAAMADFVVGANREYVPAFGQIMICEVTGRPVITQRIYYGQNNVDMSGLPSGMYVWKVVDGAYEIKEGKVVKM